jgi:hypothetical protein
MQKQQQFIGSIRLAKLVGQSRQGVTWKARKNQIPGVVSCGVSNHRGHGYQFDIANPSLKKWITMNKVAASAVSGRPGRKLKATQETLAKSEVQFGRRDDGNWGDFMKRLRNSASDLAYALRCRYEGLSDRQERELKKALHPLTPFIQ